MSTKPRKPFLCLLALACAAPLAAQSGVDTSGAGRLIEQALSRSEVIQNLQQLSDVIGPRLSGSPAMRRANEWTAERFRAYGLSATLEPYAFGVTWERGGDLKQATAVMAVTAYELANLPELLPRGPRSPVVPVPSKPSPGLAVRR